jgi:hypothetical protein
MQLVHKELQVTCLENTEYNLPFGSEFSASSRISKGQGYQGFVKKRAGSSFGQKRAICVVQGKT